MERIVNITLHKSVAGVYTFTIDPLNVLVSPFDEDGVPMQVRWVLREDPANVERDAEKLVIKFNQIPTPFTIVRAGESLPTQENYVTATFSTDGDPRAEIVTANVQNSAAGTNDDVPVPYKYTVSVLAKDGREIKIEDLDPWVRVRRTRVTREDVFLNH